MRFVLARDRRDRFAFAPLQSRTARELLLRHGLDSERLDTFRLVTARGTDAERVLSKGRAALRVARELGWPWRAACVLGVLPTRVLDWAYDAVARNRMRVFGRLDACRVPTEAERRRFVDDDAEASVTN